MVERRVRMQLGLFVTATLVGLGALIVLFGRAPDLFSNKTRYVVVFPEAPGVAQGTPIRKSGVRIGEVTALDLDPETGQVRVGIAVDQKFLPRRNEEATITRGLLSGDTAIDFLPKLNEDGLPLPRGDAWPPGSEIPGVPPVTARSLLTPASGVIASAQQSLDRIVRSFERIERVAPRLEQAAEEIALLARDTRQFIPDLKKTNERLQNLIGSDTPAPAGRVVPAGGVQPAVQPPGPLPPPQEAATLRALVKDIQETVRAVRPAVEEIRGAVKRVEPDLSSAAKSARQAFDSVNDVLGPENRKQVNELLRTLNGIGGNVLRLSAGFQGLIDEAQGAVRNFDRRTALTEDVLADIRAVTKPLAERSEPLARDLAEAVAGINKAAAEVREVLRVFARENGTIQRLLADPSVYQSLDAAAGSLARVLARAEKIARDLEVFADKVARRPELIGVGGALRPSSGLKESPVAPLPSYRPDWPPAIPARPGSGPGWLQGPAGSAPPAPVQGYPPRP